MKAIKKVMLPFDFSEAAVHALYYSLGILGKQQETELLVLHVSVNPVNTHTERQLAEDFRKILLGYGGKIKKNPRLLIVSGNLLDSILSATIDHGIDLVIMGTMGDKQAKEALTNTAMLIEELNATVLVVPFGCEIALPREIALLIGNEKLERPSVLNTLLEFANTFNSKVHVLTIYNESILAEYGVDNPTEDALEYYLEHFFAEHHFKKDDDIEHGIMEYIKAKNIDLLCIIPRHHIVQTAPSEGKLTRLLSMHSNVPMLVLD